MEIKALKQLIQAAARPETNATVNFADAQSAAKNAILEYFNIADTNIRDIKKYGLPVFAIIEEVIEQILPAELNSRVGDFAEIRSFARDETVKFTLKGLGKNRVLRSIVKGARGGMYRAHKLDDRDFMVTSTVYTVGYGITLEELLSGRRTIAELVDLIAKGFVEIIYAEVIKMLRTTATYAPAANQHSAGGIDTDELNRIIRTISAYGTPLIIGFQSEVEMLHNVSPLFTGFTPNISVTDIEEVRNTGRISAYRGTKIIVLPNYFMDEANEQWMFNESQLFILPVGERPVKVALHGEMLTQELPQATGGFEYHAHQLMGFGIVFFNNIGIYEDTSNTNDEGTY